MVQLQRIVPVLVTVLARNVTVPVLAAVLAHNVMLMVTVVLVL
jgi:hypothetical protein